MSGESRPEIQRKRTKALMIRALSTAHTDKVAYNHRLRHTDTHSYTRVHAAAYTDRHTVLM